MMNDNERVSRKMSKILCYICLILALMMFSGCESRKESNEMLSVNGSLVPKTILSYKTPYVGDNSKVVNAVDSLLYSEFRQKVTLQTESKPYGITVEYEINKAEVSLQEIESNMYLNAVLLFSLIDNVDEINFSLYGSLEKKLNYVRDDIQKQFEKDLRDYSVSTDLFEQLISNVSFRVTVFPKKYTPAMSSVPGIRLSAYDLDAVERVRYSAEKGSLFLWNEEMSKNLSVKEVYYGGVVYWSPSSEGNIIVDEDVITIALLDENGYVTEEHELRIAKDDELMYIVEPAPYIIFESWHDYSILMEKDK